MRIPWHAILPVAARVGGAVLSTVPAAEKIGKALGVPRGAEKAVAVLDVAVAELQAASTAAGRDLSTDPLVVDAIRRLIDDTVDLHNALANAAARVP